MKNYFKSTLFFLLTMTALCCSQTTKATGNHQQVGFIQFSYVIDNDDPIIITPLGGGYLGIPASAIVYDDCAVEITFYCSNGAADAEICDGDIVVGNELL